MIRRLQRALRPVGRFVDERVARWRTGSRESQLWALGALLVCVGACFLVSLVNYGLMPLTAYFVWLLLGMLLLRFWPLVVLVVAASGAGVTGLLGAGELTSARVTALVVLALCVLLILYQSSRQRSGLPVPLGEAMLSDLRDRLQSQGKVPHLPVGWDCQSAMLAADGVSYAGDFLVAHLSEDERHLELILVDVCGKGVAAGPEALQFAGALGGLVGALPPAALLAAANDFLLRQPSDETFATAVHVIIDLRSGSYGVMSAGHPPALRWCTLEQVWHVDNARGTALGIDRRPELQGSAGVLTPGEALLFYTDGVVESRDADLDDGIDWLRRTATTAVGLGFDGAARRIIRQVHRGDDDRAVLILSRSEAA